MLGAQRLMRQLAVLAMASMAPACYSEVPLDLTPNVAVDPSLIGDWTCSSPIEALAGRLKVKALDRHRYALSWSKAEGGKRERLVAYASSVGGRTLFNVRLDPPQSSRWWDHPWLLAAVGVSSGALQIQVLAEGTISGTERSPEELRASLTRALGRSEILHPEMTLCRRRK